MGAPEVVLVRLRYYYYSAFVLNNYLQELGGACFLAKKGEKQIFAFDDTSWSSNSLSFRYYLLHESRY